MRVISEKEINKEMEYLEKQKQIIADEREKIMLERSKIYYEWKDIEQEKQDMRSYSLIDNFLNLNWSIIIENIFPNTSLTYLNDKPVYQNKPSYQYKKHPL